MAFCGFLKLGVAVDVLLGPFIDDTDGKSAETGLTIDVEISKNGQGLVNKNDATAPVHDAGGTVDGYYNCELDDTDTGTLGIITLVAHAAGFLPVRQDYQVIPAIVYDAMYAAAGTDYLQVDTVEVGGTAQTAKDIGAAADSIVAAVITNAAGADIAADIIAAKAQIDTNGLDINAAIGNQTIMDGKLDTIDNFIDSEVAAIKGVTDKLDTALELDGAVYKFTENALEEAPSGTGGDATSAKQDTIIQILTGKWEIKNNQLIMYAADGTTPLYTFNLTQDGTATEFNPDKRSPV